jgi:hypothetical protein
MKRGLSWYILIGLVMLGACAPSPTKLAPVEQGGWLIYSESRIRTPIACGPTPIQLTGDRLDTKLTGECHYVRITGAHNDIEIDVAPGGTIEMLGTNNDVFWNQVRPGPSPRLINNGSSNTFHQKQS